MLEFKNRIVAFLRAVREEKKLSAIYKKYEPFTMIPKPTYIANLSLVCANNSIGGSIVECGVWRGGMIAGIADVLGAKRDFHLFDSFQGLPPAQPIDGVAALTWQADKHSEKFFDNCSASVEFAMQAMKIAGAKNAEYHPGWFHDTLGEFKSADPIAILRLDGDWYESTMTCLTALYPRMAPNGIIILDDYNTWDGCSRAIHDYLSLKKSSARIRQWQGDVTYVRIPANGPMEAPT